MYIAGHWLSISRSSFKQRRLTWSQTSHCVGISDGWVHWFDRWSATWTSFPVQLQSNTQIRAHHTGDLVDLMFGGCQWDFVVIQCSMTNLDNLQSFFILVWFYLLDVGWDKLSSSVCWRTGFRLRIRLALFIFVNLSVLQMFQFSFTMEIKSDRFPYTVWLFVATLQRIHRTIRIAQLSRDAAFQFFRCLVQMKLISVHLLWILIPERIPRVWVLFHSSDLLPQSDRSVLWYTYLIGVWLMSGSVGFCQNSIHDLQFEL